MKTKLVLFLSCCLMMFGCGHATKSPVTTGPSTNPPVVESEKPTPPVVTEQNKNTGDWQEVNGSNWSFKIPGDWTVNNTDADSGVEVTCLAPDNSLLVLFGSEDATSLESYAKQFATSMAAQGAEIIKVVPGQNKGRDAVLVVFRNDNVIVGALVLFEGKKAYTLGCGGPMATFRKNMHVCGEIVQTLEIDKK